MSDKSWENVFKNDEYFTVYCVFSKRWGGNRLDRPYVFKHNAMARVKQYTDKGFEAWMVEAHGKTEGGE